MSAYYNCKIGTSGLALGAYGSHGLSKNKVVGDNPKKLKVNIYIYIYGND